jgi:hypothetical protein
MNTGMDSFLGARGSTRILVGALRAVNQPRGPLYRA